MHSANGLSMPVEGALVSSLVPSNAALKKDVGWESQHGVGNVIGG